MASIKQFSDPLTKRKKSQPVPTVQRKMKVGSPNDKSEQEANNVADRVMRMPANEEQESVNMQPQEEEEKVAKISRQAEAEEEDSSMIKMQPEEEEKNAVSMKPEEKEASLQKQEDEELQKQADDEEKLNLKSEEKENPSIQKQADEEDKINKQPIEEEEPSISKASEDKEEVNLKSTTASVMANYAPSRVVNQINASQSGGQPLPKKANAELSQKMGRDFSDVKIHNDSRAVQMNKDLSAKAFTHKNHIYFNKGQYNPESSGGKHLLAHELTHVVQQSNNIKFNLKNQISKVSNSLILRKSKKLCKIAPYNSSSNYIKAKVKASDNMTKIVRRLMKLGNIIVNGRVGVYSDEMVKLNYNKGNPMHPNDCIVLKRKWNDPNIGKLPLKYTDLTNDLQAKIIATIYGEQTQDEPDQHKYIWLTMRKRIESWEKPSQFIMPGTKPGVLSQYDAFGNTDYKWAKQYLITGKHPLPLKEKHKFNQAVVDKIKAIVIKNWKTSYPNDIGMFYFHWTKNVSPFLNNCWKTSSKITDLNKREMHCVEQFRKHLGWNVVFKKKIRDSNMIKGGIPYGTMYIFKSTRKP